MLQKGMYRLVLVLLFAPVYATGADTIPAQAQLRERMVSRQIQNPLDGRPAVANERVLAAMREVPRHKFVSAGLADLAYKDRPLPIGHGQTISQPYIVAAMTDLVEPRADDVVLEVGTGSGYQAAVLAQIVKRVYSIEIVEPLAQEAAVRLEALGYANIEVRAGDGYLGWPERAPFDAIIVTAAPDHIPLPLVEQLKPGGRMVIPVGAKMGSQELIQLVKREDGSVKKTRVMAVRFVPLTGEHAR